MEEEAGNDECNHATLLEQECWTFSEQSYPSNSCDNPTRQPPSLDSESSRGSDVEEDLQEEDHSPLRNATVENATMENEYIRGILNSVDLHI